MTEKLFFAKKIFLLIVENICEKKFAPRKKKVLSKKLFLLKNGRVEINVDSWWFGKIENYVRERWVKERKWAVRDPLEWTNNELENWDKQPSFESTVERAQIPTPLSTMVTATTHLLKKKTAWVAIRNTVFLINTPHYVPMSPFFNSCVAVTRSCDHSWDWRFAVHFSLHWIRNSVVYLNCPIRCWTIIVHSRSLIRSIRTHFLSFHSFTNLSHNQIHNCQRFPNHQIFFIYTKIYIFQKNNFFTKTLFLRGKSFLTNIFTINKRIFFTTKKTTFQSTVEGFWRNVFHNLKKQYHCIF